jgi:ElaB/YqjD/DUF883 family membrane-anchored ribosome-binding protein
MEREMQSRHAKTELGRTYGGAARASVPRRDIAGEFGERAAAGGEAAIEWMQARPVASVAIGLALGVLIGLAFGRSIR